MNADAVANVNGGVFELETADGGLVFNRVAAAGAVHVNRRAVHGQSFRAGIEQDTVQRQRGVIADQIRRRAVGCGDNTAVRHHRICTPTPFTVIPERFSRLLPSTSTPVLSFAVKLYTSTGNIVGNDEDSTVVGRRRDIRKCGLSIGDYVQQNG